MAENNNIKGTINSLTTYHTDAYMIAVKNGFEGTEAEWLESLRARNTEEAIAAANRAMQGEKNVKAAEESAKANVKAAEDEAVAHLASLAEGAYDIVQTPGDSETQVMSQKATTEYVKGYISKVATRNLMTLTFQNAAIDNGNFNVRNSGVEFAASPDYIEVVGGETYTLSWVAKTTSANIYVHEYKADKTYIKYTSNVLGASPFTLTLDSECSYIRIHFYSWVTTPWEDIVPNNFQMEKGAEATVYAPPLVIDNDEIDTGDLAKRMRESGVMPKTEAYLDTLPSSEQLPASAWEYGVISNTDGSESAAVGVLRVRTKGYIQLRAGDVITVSSQLIDVFEYDPVSLDYLGNAGDWVSTHTIQNDCLARIMVNNYNSLDLEAITATVTITRNSKSRVQFDALPIDDLRRLSEKVAEDKLAEIDVKSPIPAYYIENNYLKNKVEAIRGYISASNGNYDVFIFCTDMHWTLNAKNSPSIINYLSGKVHINRLFTGGDLADGINMDVIKELNTCFKGSLYNVSGNHEYFDRFEEEGEINYSKTITGGDVWQYLDGQMTDAIVGNATCNYYYVDNITQKMRYIILASFTADLAFELGAEQETWLRDTALNMPEGYTAIIFTHSMGTENTADNTLTIHGAGTSVMNICDASEANIACIIAGHTHVDIMAKTATREIPIFVTTCDKYGPWISDGVDMEPWLSNRVEGTITEQAFDVFVVDKTNRQINAVRIGCPAIDGATTGLEVRTQTF